MLTQRSNVMLSEVEASILTRFEIQCLWRIVALRSLRKTSFTFSGQFLNIIDEKHSRYSNSRIRLSVAR